VSEVKEKLVKGYENGPSGVYYNPIRDDVWILEKLPHKKILNKKLTAIRLLPNYNCETANHKYNKISIVEGLVYIGEFE